MNTNMRYIINEYGIKPIWPFPIRRYYSGKFAMLIALVYQAAKPDPTIITEKVTIKDTTFNFPMKKPLNAPMKTPIAIIVKIPKETLPVLWIIDTPTIAALVMIMANERSILPMIIMGLTPNTNNPSTDTCLNTLVRLFTEKKPSANTDNNTSTITIVKINIDEYRLSFNFFAFNLKLMILKIFLFIIWIRACIFVIQALI